MTGALGQASCMFTDALQPRAVFDSSGRNIQHSVCMHVHNCVLLHMRMCARALTHSEIAQSRVFNACGHTSTTS